MNSPTKYQLWKKYPELPGLWSEYIRLCRLPAPVSEVSWAFEKYRLAYLGHKARYQIVEEIAEPVPGVAS